MTLSPLRRMLCAALAHVLAKIAEGDIHESAAMETLISGGWRIEIYASRVPAETPDQSTCDPLSDVEQAALDAATKTPVSREKLARLAGYAMNSHFSAAVTALIRRRLLVQGPDGITLP